ncbi:YbaB/EbfC family nucleoid-associated protein [Rhodococcus kronopolitis]|uniref:YbaB/EbfC family nucleoid-associated protein n=1 Tax=Rhodococcus kronopolitis TaxID=1460226 RepID=A0ABV9FT08_9NOCA
MTDDPVETLFDDLAAKARRIEQAVARIRGSAVSTRGDVTVEVDAAHRLTALRITDTAPAGGVDALATAIADTHRAACDSADAAARALRDELTADPTVARVLDRLRTHPPSAASPPAPSAADPFRPRGPILREI